MHFNKTLIIHCSIALGIGVSFGFVVADITPHTLFYDIIACVGSFAVTWAAYDFLAERANKNG